ncbi:response regulator receiver domain [Chitinophaga filiformis]|uniref:Response regulator receiver domain n=1 Tax=Chitinophaga filiformis TaxID=104663 RepID=A0ABY4I9A9_CHIFI|nr:response regulator receiver domain [Chitinophaga filiformis]UPK72460.1 response regulator receiver domain [Chitinophaga filiformis]
MAETFLDESTQIADDFIRTISFIDDQPFFNESEDPVNESMDHRLNAGLITKTFAKTGKICAFFQYKDLTEENNVLNLSENSDVCVIDWRIILNDSNADKNPEKQPVDGSVAEVVAAPGAEEDVEETESRGKYALRLIEALLRRQYNSPKLILILTAEYDSSAIFRPISDKLAAIGIDFEHNQEGLFFQNSKSRIAIYFKEALSTKAHISEEVKKKIVSFSSLPNVVNSEFALLTNGLIPNVALKCISEIRANTFTLLGSYNSSLDPAYLTHRSLLPNTNDAEDHLIEIIGADIKAIIKGKGISESVRTNSLPRYIDYKFTEPSYTLNIAEKDRFTSIDVPDQIDKAILTSIVVNGIEKTFFKNSHPMNEKMIFSKNCYRDLTLTFVANQEEANTSNIRFAMLTSLKPSYGTNSLHLSQGVILKDDKRDGGYWLCIQPKCDSVRIETVRRFFLFLKLVKVNENKFNIVLREDNDYSYFKINYQIYDSMLIPFKIDKQSNSGGVVVPEVVDGVPRFLRVDNNQKMIWIAELKNDFAQSISNNFSAQLSRVGLDLSEWLRRNSQ